MRTAELIAQVLVRVLSAATCSHDALNLVVADVIDLLLMHSFEWAGEGVDAHMAKRFEVVCDTLVPSQECACFLGVKLAKRGMKEMGEGQGKVKHDGSTSRGGWIL